MNARYHDTMTCVMHDGPPSVFLTFTANPKWPEITNSLAYGQSVEDRPDVVARVFHAKLQELREDIEKGHVLGTCKCLVYTVEFQKRGLPHAHMVVILDEGDRIRSIEEELSQLRLVSADSAIRSSQSRRKALYHSCSLSMLNLLSRLIRH